MVITGIGATPIDPSFAFAKRTTPATETETGAASSQPSAEPKAGYESNNINLDVPAFLRRRPRQGL